MPVTQAPIRSSMAGAASRPTPLTEAMMAEADRVTRARRSGLVPLCAVLLSALCGLWVPGCLNPLPDDQPSSQNIDNAGEQPNPPEGELDGAGPGAGDPVIDVGELPPPAPGGAPPDPEPVPDAGAPEAGVTSDDDCESSVQ